MEYQVRKRDGNNEPFDKSKIVKAVCLAFEDIDGSLTNYAKNKANFIANHIEELVKEAANEGNILSVEDIQNQIEDRLSASQRRDVASSYIRYRYKKEVARNFQRDFIDAIREKLSAKNVQNQNANVDEYSFGGRIGEASGVVTKKLALDYVVSDMARNNHLNNEIYIHDLDAYYVGNHNCLSIPFDDLLANGFNTRQTDVRPANSINTAFQLVAVIFQLQSLQQFGGVSATHLDWTMVPYVRKSFYKHFVDGLNYFVDPLLAKMHLKELDNSMSIDDTLYKLPYSQVYQYAMEMTQRELDQAVEGMYHNLNTLQSRSGNQLPFTSINYGTCTLPEGRMVIESLLRGSIKGVGKFHKTSIFPCGIFQYMKGVNDKPGTPNYDLYRLALESTSKRLYPNYANVDWTGNAGYDVNDPKTYFSTMGCRTTNGVDINAEPGVNPQTKDGRGNICPVTIIMPTLAMEAREQVKQEYAGSYIPQSKDWYDRKVIEKFFFILGKKIEEARDMLIERYEWICSQSPASAKFMYENHTMLGYKPEEGIRSALKHGTLVIGQLGLAETLQLLIGCDHTTEEGMKLAKQIEQLFKDRCAEYKQLYKLNFGVYYTPAENLCYTAMKKFRDKYGIIPKVSDKEYFTNSIHVPVYHNLSVFDKIDIESQLTGYSNAGCITYVELDSTAQNNIDALEEIVNYAMNKDIPYFAINVPSDQCLSCGYSGDINDTCPECGSKNIQQLRRVTGYLTGNYTTAFNWGKQKETEARVKHANIME